MERRDVLYLPSNDRLPSDLLNIRSAGWELHVASSAERARELVSRHDFHVGIAQLDSVVDNHVKSRLEVLSSPFRQMNWIALLPRADLRHQDTRRFIVDSFYDYHTLPPNLERLLVTLGHAYGMADMCRGSIERRQTQPEDCEMVGDGPAMRHVRATIRKFARVDAPVLITGESGTGKELAAKRIHEYSARASKQLVTINCVALPANLVQSELFGHEKGAFTGAHQRKIGRLEAAAGGIIVLDEIGDLPLELQANLLRFLQEKTLERVGGTATIALDVRVIAVTNVDLERAVTASKFREDLYHRLNVLHLEIPPLRERREDIEPLAEYFLNNHFVHEKNPYTKGFNQQALHAMNLYHWPGNVRELMNRIRRAVAMCETERISPSDLGLERRQSDRRPTTLDEARAIAERQAILTSFQANRCRMSATARELGVSRVTLYRLVKRHGIRP